MDKQEPVVKIGSKFLWGKSEVVVTKILPSGVEITIDGRPYSELIPLSTFESCQTT